MSDDRTVAPGHHEDDSAEASLRPQTLAEFIGQKASRENLRIFIQAARGRGEALDRLEEFSDAARAYLGAFSADPAGEVAPDALLGLGRNLGRLGQVPDACITLGEIATRFPASPLLLDAEAERRTLACP